MFLKSIYQSLEVLESLAEMFTSYWMFLESHLSNKYHNN